jgi:ABC-2 type transport system ATP-binding protein
MLQIRDLRKSFGSLRAVDGVSFEIAAGEIVGGLGPNGAGKTTTVSLIVGLLRPDSGEVLIQGSALRADTDPAKSKLGLVPQELALYDELSARENLRFFGGLHGVIGHALDRAIASALALVGLEDRATHRVATFSGGMKRRLNLAAGLLPDPQILLLDEPTVGVDPQSRNAIFDNLEAQEAGQGPALHDPLHGRGRATLRPHRDHRSRQGRCPGHAPRPLPAPASDQ